MKYQLGEYEAVHQEPVWRDRANFVFAAHIGTKDGNNEWEQLWGEKTAPHRFILCCIPFFTNDVALGDEVETDADFVLKRVIHHAGQVTFRVWFGAQDTATRTALVREIEALKPLMEWSSENLLALSTSDGGEAQKTADYLQAREEQGVLHYETGRTEQG
jgi:hypothetical protein